MTHPDQLIGQNIEYDKSLSKSLPSLDLPTSLREDVLRTIVSENDGTLVWSYAAERQTLFLRRTRARTLHYSRYSSRMVYFRVWDFPKLESPNVLRMA